MLTGIGVYCVEKQMEGNHMAAACPNLLNMCTHRHHLVGRRIIKAVIDGDRGNDPTTQTPGLHSPTQACTGASTAVLSLTQAL
jgi:hypothetical protein